MHPLWLAECIKTESRALEWAFPSTFKSGTSLSFGLTPVSSATPRLSQYQRPSRGASAPQLDMHDDSIVTAGNSTDNLPPPIDVHLPAHSQPQLHSKPPASARVIRPQPHLEPTKSAGKPTEHLSEDCRHPADRTFDPIIPSNILNNSSGANSPRVQSPVKDSAPHASVNVLSGLKSLFGAKDDTHSSGTERDNGRVSHISSNLLLSAGHIHFL